jgi:catechol 2,3-dioxygenase-like lactoylglutathione lyase family enzyme
MPAKEFRPVDRHLDGIDHLIIGVRDLEAARARYARLGFNTTPRGRHVGWGTANYCVMFADDYLELLGIVDPAGFTNNLDRLLEERGEGLLGVALGSRDAAGTHAAWAAAGLAPAAPRALGRLLEADGAPLDLRFSNVMLGTVATAGVSLFACQHLTPDLLRRPAWLAHPNGARRIRSCTIVADDPGPVAEAMAKVFGSAAITSTDNVLAVHTGRGVILIAPPADADLMHPAAAVPETAPEPRLRVLSVEVADPDRAFSFLALQGVVFHRTAEGALIPPEQAHGVALELVR